MPMNKFIITVYVMCNFFLANSNTTYSRVGWAWPTFSCEPRLEWWAVPHRRQDKGKVQSKQPIPPFVKGGTA